MAVTADTLAADHRALTEACGLVDRSERGKLALTGPDAKAFLHGQVTNDIEGLEPGRGCYAAFLTHKGKMLGDMRVLDLGDELLLDTERATLQELFNMIRRFKLGSDVELHKRTLELGLLSLVGPDARRVAGADGARAARARQRARRDRRHAGRARGDRRRRRRVRAGRRDRRGARRARGRRRRRRSPRRPPRRCASSAAGRATASTSTTARSRRRPA